MKHDELRQFKDFDGSYYPSLFDDYVESALLSLTKRGIKKVTGLIVSYASNNGCSELWITDAKEIYAPDTIYERVDECEN